MYTDEFKFSILVQQLMAHDIPCFLVLLCQKVVQELDIFKFSIESRTQNSSNTDSVFIHHFYSFGWVHHVVAFRQLHFLQLHLKIPCKFLPADL